MYFFVTDVDKQTRTHIFELLLYTHIFSEQNQSLSLVTYIMDLAVSDILNRIQFITCNILYPCYCTVYTSHSPDRSAPSFLQGMVIRFNLLGRSMVT